MTALARRLRLWVPCMGIVLLALPLVLAVGCGSGSGDTTTDAAAPPRTGNDDAGHAIVRKQAAKAEGGQRRAGSGNPRPAASGKDRGGVDKTSRRSIHTQAGAGSPSPTRSGKQKVSSACPSGISRSECETLVAGYQQTKDKPSHAVQEPEDCLKAMGRAECEGLLEGQQEAAEEAGSSVDVQQCLRKPTPRCEEILQAAFEAQVAAGATGK